MDEFSARVSLRSAMDEEFGLFTVYHSSGGAQRTLHPLPGHLTRNRQEANGKRKSLASLVSVQRRLVPILTKASATGSSATASTKPTAKARCALTFSAATNICKAIPLPTSRGNRCVPPHPVINPRAAPRCPNTAFGAAIRRWQASAKSSPPPMQYPETAAYTGAGNSSKSRIKSWPILEKSYPASPSRAAISLRSAPAEKIFSFPVTSSGRRCDRNSSKTSWRAVTHSHVSRFVPSLDRRRKTLTPSSRSR